MTDDELKALVAGLALSQQETAEQMKQNSAELKALGQQTDEQMKRNSLEMDKLFLSQQETAELIKKNSEESNKLFLSQQKTDEQMKRNSVESNKLFLSQQETAEQMKRNSLEMDKLILSQQENAAQLKELKIQIGGLGNKFGGFTEGLALPSMTKVLREEFQMETIAPRIKARHNGGEMEVDVLAYSNQTINRAYLVEVKSLLDTRAIEQILQSLQQFPHFFPEHKDKQLYGILAFVDSKQQARTSACKKGLYLATIHDDLFELSLPEGFQPKVFS